MINDNISKLRDLLWQEGVQQSDFALVIAAYVTAGQLRHTPRSGDQSWMAQLASRLPNSAEANGLAHAKEWLQDDFGLLGSRRSAVDNFWYAHPATPLGGKVLDDVAGRILREADAAAPVFIPADIAVAVADLVAPPNGEPCTCIFAPLANVAWQLAAQREVEFWPGDPTIAMAVALLAFAGRKNLHTRYRNPIDGGLGPVFEDFTRLGRASPVREADHIIAAPPFGVRAKDAAGRSFPIEMVQIQSLLPKANKSFQALVSDGILFRETRGEADFRTQLLHSHAVSVTSLPAGMWGRQANVSAALLKLVPGLAQTITFRNGRDIPGQTSMRPSTTAIAGQVAKVARAELPDDQVAEVEVAVVLANGSILLPAQYIRSASDRMLQSALSAGQSVKLADVADIERPKAPAPTQEPADDDILCYEVTPADIVDGFIREPNREIRFSAEDRKQVGNITIEFGDIVVSIKGGIGLVGQMDIGASIAAAVTRPWVVSQSLAIIRYRKNELVANASLLGSILSAPWVQDRLKALSAGSAVKILPIAALRSLDIPVPEDLAATMKTLKNIDEMRDRVANLQKNLSDERHMLWRRLWNMAEADEA